ncbi:MAG: CoA protein activase [Nitrospirae bacterium]|nr:CoA protein activase [Nitrospirota bacterium]
MFAGLDAGSVSVKIALLDAKGNILKTDYIRHKGRPLAAAYDLLRSIDSPHALSITGSAGRIIADVLGLEPVNEVVAQSYSTSRFYPHVNTVFEMGGEDSKLILLENGKIKEFSMNSACAAGTGSFLDQQAERLRLSIEEFGEMALRSQNPPRIAGRCSVFAKSDMIHLQQIATPVEDIVAGLCFAVARNFKGSICKNTEPREPVSFQGGVAANRGVVRAFKEVFGIDNLIIPEHFAIMPAIGAALKNIEEGNKRDYDIEKLRLFIESGRNGEKGHEPLKGSYELRVTSNELRNSKFKIQNSKLNSSLPLRAYLGIDIGSISTNLAVVDEEGRLLSKRYLMTAGRPIEAVRQGLEEVGQEIGGKVQIMGVGTTGSGRYMIADFVGADIVKNEITAQATAAIFIDPRVDTIFEIGGQDSKYISIGDGIIVDFEMNKSCAAGTGSFLEEQAEKLSISIKEEFSERAFKSQCPSCLGERCTVFMENSMVSRQQRGAPKEDLVAGLAYSIVQNYINKVVGDRKIGERIFFQGGVAFNKAVIAAFEKYLNKKIMIPPNHDVTGAIGMALIAMRRMKDGKTLDVRREELEKQNSENPCLTPHVSRLTAFKGFDLSRRKYEIKSFACHSCENLCEINTVRIEGEKEPLFYGSRCEKYDVKRKKKYASAQEMPDLFAEREEMLTKAHMECKEKLRTQNSKLKARVGIPRIFFFHDFLPFWSTLLWELGFDVELSERTNRNIIQKGLESILSESCFPHKVAHGHIKDLIDKKVDAILLPSFINFNPANSKTRSFACPYVQTIPYIAKQVFGKNARSHAGIKFLSPLINTEYGKNYFLKEIHDALKPYGISVRRLKEAVINAEKAQKEFTKAIKARGREILGSLAERAIVVVGRSYNASDSGINLEIPKKLSEIGVLPIPMDFLPIELIDITEKWHNMYWRSGQNILRAAEIIRSNPNLFAFYIGNFSCGPDSFIHRYFKEAMEGKPFLHIEIDEHSADAGVITRAEAFLDSIEQQQSGVRDLGFGIWEKKEDIKTNPQSPTPKPLSLNRRTVFIPRMSDHAFALASAFEACGVGAEVLDTPDAETVKIGRRFVSGKECYPCVVTTGDMVKKASSTDFNPEKSAFLMASGSGPCRFGQYNVYHRLVLREIGFPDVPIFSPNQDVSLYKELGVVGSDFTRHAWKGIIATELLIKCLHETRPYEVNKGDSEWIYNEYLTRINRTLKSTNGNGSMENVLRHMKDDFSAVKRTNNGRKPLVGIVGEIFVRHNAFSNEDIIKKIETLGGEVWLAPFEEWIYYINSTALQKAKISLRNNPSLDKASDMLNILATGFIQKKIEHKFSKPFKGFLKTLKEPDTGEIMRNASPYLHRSFEGEAVLSIGKAMDFIKHGISGIISVMPFGCMPGTIVGALLKGVKHDTGVACLSVSYDGVEATCSEIQLEAFMHQAKEYNKSREGGG